MMGNKILTGEEGALMVAHAQFHGGLNWRKTYKDAKIVGLEDLDGKPAYKLLLTAHGGPSETRFYDAASKLLVKTSIALASGSTVISTTYEDHRKVDNILMAHKLTQSVQGQKIVITFSSIKHNVDIPETRFDLPEPIKALTENQKDETPTKTKDNQ